LCLYGKLPEHNSWTTSHVWFGYEGDTSNSVITVIIIIIIIIINKYDFAD